MIPTTTMGDKLYVVVRKDMPTGVQMAQQGHAISEYWCQHQSSAKEWHDLSNFICVLHIDNEPQLKRLMADAYDRYIPAAHFCEPDMNDAMTAGVIHHSGKALVKDLQLAFAPIA